MKRKKILLLIIKLITIAVIIIVIFLLQKQNKQNIKIDHLESICIKDKDQAVDILLGTGLDLDADTPTMTYKKQVENRGNEIFFEEYPSGIISKEMTNIITIGEALPNGGKLLHARYSYQTNLCDIDLDKEDISLSDSEKKYQFSFTNSDGVKDQFIDDTITCQYYDPTTQLLDIDGDSKEEVVVDCFQGGSINRREINIYKEKDSKLGLVGSLDTEGHFKLGDCNGDRVADITTYFRADAFKDCDEEVCMKDSKWINVVFCNSWDSGSNEFIDLKIGEE